MSFKLKGVRSCLLLVLFTVLFLSEAEAKKETRTFNLPQADAAASSTQIPFQVSVAGTISANLTFESADRSSAKMIFVSLHQKNNPYVLASTYLRSGRTGIYLRHEVRDDELDNGNEYFLSVNNYSQDTPLTGEVLLRYPVSDETEIFVDGEMLPNLAVTAIELDETCKVMVTVKNLGSGSLSHLFWKKDMPMLSLYKDGTVWGEVDIRFFDYLKGLSSPGGESVFRSGLKVVGSARIGAEVDTGHKVKETEEADNFHKVILRCN